MEWIESDGGFILKLKLIKNVKNESVYPVEKVVDHNV